MRPQQTRDSLRVMRRHSDERAFTLIELLVVMTLIAILLGIGYPAFTAVMESARKTQAKNEEQPIVAAVNAYYTDYGKYAVNAANNTTNAYFGPGPVPAGSTSYGINGVLVDVLRNNSNPSGPNYATVTLLNPRNRFYSTACIKRPDHAQVRHPNFDRQLVRPLGVAI